MSTVELGLFWHKTVVQMTGDGEAIGERRMENGKIVYVRSVGEKEWLATMGKVDVLSSQ